jgi:predicted nuclease of predicted toxin-antitoxin system
MMTFLVDFNLDGYALLLLGILTKLGWFELVSIRFVTFREAGLSMDASDRLVWRYAQENQMMILTVLMGFIIYLIWTPREISLVDRQN